TLSLNPSPALERARTLAIAARPVANFSAPVQVSSGDALGGGKLGAVVRLPRGQTQLQRFDVGGWNEVLTARIHRDGFLVGGEDGLLKYSADQGKTWIALTPPERGLIAVAEPMAD